VDSTGQTLDFLLSAKRDTAAAKRFFEKVFSLPVNPIPRVINVDCHATRSDKSVCSNR
jgi:IS6 family transposase